MVEYTQTSGADGVAEFELDYGDYSVTVTYDEDTVTQDIAFRSNHKNFTVQIGEPTTVNPPLEEVEN